jgi:tRNA-(ms[2]io[6]A)-hydroxylase
MLRLRLETGPEWAAAALADFDALLLDHAACERKASATAMSFVVRYPDRKALVGPLIEVAREELAHFHEVWKIAEARGLTLADDERDPYIRGLLGHVRGGSEERLLDRLIVAAIIEARACERLQILADALPVGELGDFYRGLAHAEARHHGLYVRLAKACFAEDVVEGRLGELLDREAEIVKGLPIRAAIH